MKNHFPLSNNVFYVFFTLLISTMLVGQLKAQDINNYVFSTNQTSSLNADLNANPIDMTVGTTQLIGSSIRDGSGSGLVNFPNNFDCWFMGTKVTSFSVSSHGWLGLNLALTSANFWLGGNGIRVAPLLLNTAPDVATAQAMGTSSTGKVHYKLVGVAPNRTMVIEYLNMTINASVATSTSNDATFQVRMYEATGTIEMVYGSIAVSGTTGIFGHIGISNLTFGMQSVNPATHVSLSTLSTDISLAPGAFNPLNGGGTAVTRRAYIYTPAPPAAPSALNFSSIGLTSLMLNWTNNAIAPNAAINNEVYYSLDGNDWTWAATLAPNIATYQLTGLTPSTNYLFRVIAIKESRSVALSGNVSTLTSSVVRSTTTGGGWKNPGTWLGGILPGANDSVVITDGATVTIDSNVSCYKLRVGEGLSGVLIYDPAVARSLTVLESVTVSIGASFTAGNGTPTAHALNIGSLANAWSTGSFVNNGTFDMFTTAGVIVTFSGRLNGSITGSGTVTDFRQIVVNKGAVSANRPVLDINIPFTVQGGNVLGLISNHTAGVVRINGNFTQSNPMYASASYNIPLNGGLVLNNPNFTVVSTNGNPVCNGLLQITQGVFNVNQLPSQVLEFGNGSTFTVDGGTVNAAARVLTSGSTFAFNFSSGTINVATVGNSISNSPSFGIVSLRSVINWTGGTLNLVQRSTGATISDYNIVASSMADINITGGVLSVGTVATSGNFDFRIQGEVPTLIIDTVNNRKSAVMIGSLTVNQKIKLHTGVRLNINGFFLTFKGDTFENNGVVSGNSVGGIEFSGKFLQVYTGTGADTIATLYNKNNSLGVKFNKQVVTYGVSFESATPFINSNNIILGNGLNQAVNIYFGGTDFALSTVGFDVFPTLNLGTGTYSLAYYNEATPKQTGREIPANRTVNSLFMNNAKGLLLSGGNLDITGILTLTTGIITSSDTAMLRVVNTVESAIGFGSSLSYVRGPLVRRLPASLTSTNTYSFPIGNSSNRLIRLVNTRTKAAGFVDVRMQYYNGLVTGIPNGTSLTTINPDYVQVSIATGGANLDSTFLNWTQTGMIPTNRLAYADSLNGIYRAVSGSPSGSIITTNSLAKDSALRGFFALGEYIVPLAGNYLIGASKTTPNYPSITAFLNDLNGKQVQGNVTLLLDNDYVSTNETFPITLARFYTNNPNWTITIKPNVGINPVISGISTSSIFRIAGASKYIIDGSNNGSNSRNLTIQNTSATSNSAGIWLSSLGVGVGSSNNIIRNLRISCGADQSTSSANTFGVILSGTSASFFSVGNDNDSNQIINNEITRVRYGIFSIGGAITNPNEGNRIVSNLIGPTAFGIDQIGKGGIVVREEQRINIDNNEVRFVGALFAQTPAASERVGISLGPDASWPTISAFVKQARVTRNKIHDIVDEKANSAVGIVLSSWDGTSNNTNTDNVIANNDIYAIRTNGSLARQTVGIGLLYGRNDSILFNTINLNGDLDPAGTNNSTTSSFGLSIANSSVANPIIQNNLISVNLSSNTSSLFHAVINIPSGFVWGNGLFNNNLLFASPVSPQMRLGCIGGSGGTFYQTLSSWQSATGQDFNSISLDPQLSRPFNSIPDFYSPAIGAGVQIPGYTKDLLDSTRSNPPTIGSYEKPIDLKSPFISFANLSNDTSLTSRNVFSFASITDTSGINPASGFKPRIYYKKTHEANVFGSNNSSTNGWKWVEASNNSSPYNFSINYGLLFNPAALNDTIQYFVVAQDNTASINVGSFPSVGFQGTSVSNITSAPSAPLTYKIVLLPLAGNYFVGNAKTFPTISNAMLAAHERGIIAPVTFVLTDSLYRTSTGEVFPIEVRNIPGASAMNSVTLRPDSGVTTSIRDSINGVLFNLNGVNHFSINGVQLTTGITKRLTISNTHLSANAAAVRFINDASNNRLESVVIGGANVLTSGNSGVVVFSTGLVTGNDKNSINNCEIGNALPANLPTTLVYAAGSTDSITKFNDSNTISNCYLYNYINPTGQSNAIKIVAGNNGWTISDNHIYQTAARTANLLHLVFNMQNGGNRTSLNNMRVLRNYIGGSTPFCGGTPWTMNASAGRFTSTFNMGNLGGNEFKENKINNFLCNSTNTTASIWQIVDFQGGKLNIDSNIFGSTTGRDSIVLFGGNGSTADLVMLNTAEAGEYFIRGNTFGAIKVHSGGTNAIKLALINTGTANTPLVTYSIIGNTFGNSLDSNILNTNSTSIFSSSIYGIQNNYNFVMNIRNNVFRNFMNNQVSIFGTNGNFLHPISTTIGIDTIIGNQIFNMRHQALNQINNTSGAAIIGIFASSSNPGNYIAKNTIHSLEATNTGAAPVTVSGITCGSFTNSLVDGNFIHSLTVASSDGASINGIQYLGGANNRISNNMIRLGINSNGVSIPTKPNINGIHRAGPPSGSVSVLFNTVYIGGVSSLGNGVSTFAFSRTGGGGDSIVNNIFANLRYNTNGLSGLDVAIGLNNTSFLTSANNVFYVDTNIAGYALARIGSIVYPNLTDFRGASLTDFNSIAYNPSFVSPNSAAGTVDLHINPTSPTPVEGAGVPLTGILTDFDNQQRNTLTPTDIGADAGNFTGLDLSPPNISYNNLVRDTVSSQLIISGGVAITDNSGVNTSTFKPRIYYKKRSDANVFLGNTSASNGWKFVETSSTTSPFNFTIDYTKLSGGSIVIGDTIQYFVVAQDAVGNIGANPYYGLSATSVSNIITAPTNPNSYIIRDRPLNGIYFIGSTQVSPNFISITAAVNKLNQLGISGNVVFELVDTLYNSTTETFPIEIREIYGASATKGVVIKPGAGLNVNIAGSVTSALFRLNGTDYFTIDGSNNGTNSRNLLIRNLSTSATSAVIWGYTNLLIDNPATFNVIKNARVWGSSPTGTLVCIGFGSETIALTSAGKGNNNNTITNCEIRGALNGIYLGGNSVVLKDNNNVISFNTINGTTPLNIGHRGILANFQNNLLIENNLVGNITSASNTNSLVGISLGYSATNQFYPVGSEVTNAVVRNNTIGPVASTGAASAFGICITPASSGTDSIYNNLITGVQSQATPNNYVASIYAGGGIGSVTRILHNTVSMNGFISSSSSIYGIAVGTGNPTMDIRNNIFSNSLSTFGPGKNFAIGLGSTTFTNLTLNYNAYFVTGTLSQLAVTGGIGAVGTGTELSNLNTFRAVTGKDANSVSKAVTFVSNTDAHLAGTSIGDTSLRCLPIPGITRDIDNELRNTIFTYMGADEIVSNPLPVKLLSFNAKATSTDARVTWTTAAEVSNKGFELERSFDGSTFEFAEFIEGAGNSNKINSYQFIDAGILAKAPIVYYRLKQVDYNGRFEYSETVMLSKPKTSSNEMVVYPNPTSGVISMLINTDVEENFEVTITDMNGKVVYNRQLFAQQGNNQITLQKSDELISGIYFVRVTGQQQTKVIKLVKTN